MAAIWVEGNDNISTFKRNIVVFGKNDGKPTIDPSHEACYDPLAYPLFHPNGEPGWHKRRFRVGCNNSVIDDEDAFDGEDNGAGTKLDYFINKI